MSCCILPITSKAITPLFLIKSSKEFFDNSMFLKIFKNSYQSFLPSLERVFSLIKGILNPTLLKA